MRQNQGKIVRLSATESLVLGMLIGRGELYGLQIVEESQGQIKRGSVYVTLDRMEDKGLVSSRQEDKAPGVSGIPRRLYKPTGHGARVFSQVEQKRAAIFGHLIPV